MLTLTLSHPKERGQVVGKCSFLLSFYFNALWLVGDSNVNKKATSLT